MSWTVLYCYVTLSGSAYYSEILGVKNLQRNKVLLGPYFWHSQSKINYNQYQGLWCVQHILAGLHGRKKCSPHEPGRQVIGCGLTGPFEQFLSPHSLRFYTKALAPQSPLNFLRASTWRQSLCTCEMRTSTSSLQQITNQFLHHSVSLLDILFLIYKY